MDIIKIGDHFDLTWYDVPVMKVDKDMTRRRLPIGIQTFRKIRNQDCYYVDKTALIRQMINQGNYYFLSRPRRFGKSLLVDTLHELFDGNEALFRGLDIHKYWNWDSGQRHPVLRISFGGLYNTPEALEKNVFTQLEILERRFGLEVGSSEKSGPDRFIDLLDRLYDKTGREVVVLIDEYDKPILDVLEDPELAKANRDYLRGFYGILKDYDRYIRFVFITGISMFSNVNLFSGLNNLKNLSLDPRYSTLCGYTDRDLDTVFVPELSGLNRAEIRRWYNGYSWLGDEKVYNPFDVLLLFDGREFEPYWFRTGTPTFLYRELVKQGVSPMDLENRITDRELVSTFDVTDYHIDALLFQTGYLTITGKEPSGDLTEYRLDYPNYEVELSLNRGLLRHVTGIDRITKKGEKLLRLLTAQDFDGFVKELQPYLSGIPHPWHDSADLSQYESWYASLLYMTFKALGSVIQVEEAASHGRADMVLLHADQVFVMEFKVVEGERGVDTGLEQAMVQIKEKKYGEKYRNRGMAIHHVAMCFGRAERNIPGIRAERD